MILSRAPIGLVILGLLVQGNFLTAGSRGQEPEVTGEASGDPAQETVPPGFSDPDAKPPQVESEGPILVRVGLATDLEEFILPCCEGDLVAAVGDEVIAVGSPIEITPAARIAQPGHFRLQVAALKDERQARGLAQSLTQASQERADVVFDAGLDLYRVRLGRFATRSEAEAARGEASRWGVEGAWIAHEGGTLEDPGFRITHGDEERWIEGRWLSVRGSGGEGIRLRERRFRGRILLYLNDRGTLNLINELDLEDYLRGVVPREMGPAIYDELQALKAQAVAARTYTLRNLGEFVEEGYDICATPRCQVYGGMKVEHPLTDQAVKETAGEVILYQGKPADSLYSSTCGGHTEDVKVVFPLKNEPYLRGVPCLESGVDLLRGTVPRDTPLATTLMARVLPAEEGASPPGVLAARLERLAVLAGLPFVPDDLASLKRYEVQRFVASIFDLALDAKLFVSPEDLSYLLDDPPPSWNEEALRLAAYFAKSGLETGSLEGDFGPPEIDELLLHLAKFLRVVQEEEASFLDLSKDSLRVRVKHEDQEYRMGSELATYRRRATHLVAADLALVPGDRLSLYRLEDQLLSIVQQVDPDGVAFDRTSAHASWNRFRSDEQLAQSVRTRYPGIEFRSFEILSRGVSGRVGRIRLLGEEGRQVTVEGLAVRWTLEVPDTLFTVKRLEPTQGQAGWLFTGRGWGHGVGMCQVGAFGMARRGHEYREILHHYYTGVQLGRVRKIRGAEKTLGW